MRWQDMEGSNNVEDRRGSAGGFGRRGGGMSMGRIPIPVSGKGKLVLIAVVLIAGYYGYDLTPLLTGEIVVPTQQTGAPSRPSSYQESDAEKELARLSSVLLKTTESTWQAKFAQMGKNYTPPKMVLYTGTTPTACGYGQAAMGPFYCPGDQKVYLDLSFYNDMKHKLGGGGDFAWGYVLAHEVGHHVQTLLGISSQVQRAQQSASSKAEANRMSVKMELQADCLAGVWGNMMQKQGVLEGGDLEKALKTATAIGDDRLQQQAQGRVVPDSFTHGTSEQRLKWFQAGFRSGNPEACNTFASGAVR